jgi:hypothetical protein
LSKRVLKVRPFSFCVVACTLLAASRLASAEIPWMTEDAIRADIVGETLQGDYDDGRQWTASYAGNGRYEVREGQRHAVGRWYFRGRAFCFLYGPPHWPLQERCGAVNKLSANCYEFHRIYPGTGELPDEEDFRPEQPRVSRGWRQREPSTCESRPSV